MCVCVCVCVCACVCVCVCVCMLAGVYVSVIAYVPSALAGHMTSHDSHVAILP